jgi:hypothetical protein
MKLWNNFLEGLRQAMQEFEEGLLLGADEQYETGDDGPQTGSNRFWLVAFAFAFIVWAVANMAAAGAGYVQ